MSETKEVVNGAVEAEGQAAVQDRQLPDSELEKVSGGAGGSGGAGRVKMHDISVIKRTDKPDITHLP